MKMPIVVLSASLAACAFIPQAAARQSPMERSSQAVSAARPDVFGTVALPIAHSRYDDRWNRVAATSSATMPNFVHAAHSLAGIGRAQMINAAVNRHVRYRSDAKGDYWATVRETVSRRAGDCEDIAIAKMQVLRSLGMPASELYMSIGNDVAAGQVHAILLVRIAGRFWVLDNRVDRLIPHEAFHFHPILTFSGSRTWLHGYRPGTMPEAVKALSYAAASGQLKVGAGTLSSIMAIRKNA